MVFYIQTCLIIFRYYIILWLGFRELNSQKKYGKIIVFLLINEMTVPLHDASLIIFILRRLFVCLRCVCVCVCSQVKPSKKSGCLCLSVIYATITLKRYVVHNAFVDTRFFRICLVYELGK